MISKTTSLLILLPACQSIYRFFEHRQQGCCVFKKHIFELALPLRAKRHFTATISLLLTGFSLNVQAQSLVINVDVFGPNSNDQMANNQVSTACAQIATSTNDFEADLLNTCNIVSGLNPDDPADAALLNQVLRRIGPEEAFSVNDTVVYVSDYQASYIQNRITTRRTALSQTAGALNNQDLNNDVEESSLNFRSGGNSGNDSLESRFGFFINPNVINTDINGDILEQDADLTGTSLIFGGDYRVNDEVIAGAALGFINNETKFSAVRGDTSLEGFNFTLFGTWFRDSIGYLDAILDAGKNNYNLRREIGTSIDETNGRLLTSDLFALGDTDASTITLTGTAGKYFDVKTWQLGTYARASVTNAIVDEYTESPSTETESGFSSVFTIGEQSVKSTKFVVGADISKAVSTTVGVVLPVVRFEIQNEVEENKEDLQTQLVNTGVSGIYEATNRETTFASVSLGTTAIFRNGVHAYGLFQSFLGHDFVNRNNFLFGLRVER